MNREIKFRAWVDDTIQYLQNTGIQYYDFEGSYALSFVVDGYKEFWAHENYDNESLVKRMNKAILMQYTGLKDKNGKEIYEGDIVYFEYNRLGNKVVAFNEGKYNLCGYNLSKCKIIGNIYENPNLLTK